MADKRITNRSIDAPLPVEAVQCPTCGAHPDRPCRDESEKEKLQPHQERIKIADTLNKIREHLLSSESTVRASNAFLEVSRRVYFGWLLQLLYDAVCCHQAQRQKADDFIKSWGGLNTDELEYWPKRIRNFATELKDRLEKNIFTSHDATCDNTKQDEACGWRIVVLLRCNNVTLR